jgi:putative hydrolase of the HAD superfamily
MKAVLLDLDDTLYAEMDFVRSAFGAVAADLSSDVGIEAGFTRMRMLQILRRDGRGRVFDEFLHEQRLYNPERVARMLTVYRTHFPSLRLHADVLPTLEWLRSTGVGLGIVTDGLAYVQRAKIEALGLESKVDVVVCTDELGPRCAKPSRAGFERALETLGVPPNRAIYIGNDVTKDFYGPRRLGMTAIHIVRPGVAQAEPPSPDHAPHIVVTRLGDALVAKPRKVS